jgi:uncharacterized ferredoxin-like protein
MKVKSVSAKTEPEERAVSEIVLMDKEEEELGILQYLDRLEEVTEAFFSRQDHITSRACFLYFNGSHSSAENSHVISEDTNKFCVGMRYGTFL